MWYVSSCCEMRFIIFDIWGKCGNTESIQVPCKWTLTGLDSEWARHTNAAERPSPRSSNANDQSITERPLGTMA